MVSRQKFGTTAGGQESKKLHASDGLFAVCLACVALLACSDSSLALDAYSNI